MKKTPDGYQKLTPKMREKIRKAQKKLKLKDRDVAIRLGNKLDRSFDSRRDIMHRTLTYKNYKREDSSYAFISDELLLAIADCLKIPYRYLLNDDGDECTAKNPIYQTIPPMRNELYDKLENDKESIEALHFLYCEIPDSKREQCIKAFLTFIKLFSDSSIYSQTAFFDRGEVMRKIMENDDFYNKSYIRLMEAGDELKFQNRSKALFLYLDLILTHGNKETEDDLVIFDRILRTLKYMKFHWEEFPSEISEIIQTMEKEDFCFATYPKVDTTLKDFLSKSYSEG